MNPKRNGAAARAGQLGERRHIQSLPYTGLCRSPARTGSIFHSQNASPRAFAQRSTCTKTAFRVVLQQTLDDAELGANLGIEWWSVVDNLYYSKSYALLMAEREGFEPPVRLPVLRISSAARSTTLPPLRGHDGY